MVDARVKQALAEAIEREGLADVNVKRALAEVLEREGSAQASVVEKTGLAEGIAIREKLTAEAAGIEAKAAAEASGIEAKAAAMKELDGVSREHEEFRLRLEHDRLLTMERIKSSIEVAHAQAATMAEAFKSSNINIVGGDGAFYDNFIKSVSVGHMVEGFVEHSPTARALLGRVADAAGRYAQNDGAKSADDSAAE